MFEIPFISEYLTIKMDRLEQTIKWKFFRIPYVTNSGWGLWTDEISLINSLLKPSDIVLEWGAGATTKKLSKKVKEYYSIEHDREWYERFLMKTKNDVKIKIIYVPNNLSWEFPADGTYEQFADYVDMGGKIGRQFNAVLIDGRARVACARKIIPFLKKDAIVFIHNFDRPEYRSVLEYFDLVDIRRTLAVLKPKLTLG